MAQPNAFGNFLGLDKHMAQTDFIRPNLLGDLRAEADSEMLSRAFLETADYRTLIETSDRIIVVGRRGTGKSALTQRLERFWNRADDVRVIKIAPEEHQTMGLRPKIASFGNTFSMIRAGSRLVWRYALMMEAACSLSPRYSFVETKAYQSIETRVRAWTRSGRDVFDRYNSTLREIINPEMTPEERIADLSSSLDLKHVENALAEACGSTKCTVVFLIDRLDEGYQPDDSGIAIVDGLVQAAIDVKTRLPRVKPVIFLRDNIFRAVQAEDPDYSRNIEGHVLRLHWDAESLFNFATRRLKIAFGIDQEASVRIWNRCTAGDISGREGFNRCLQLTLYRPRDLLSLLNEAFYQAGRQGQAQIISTHIEDTGRSISRNRLDDLKKEYLATLPGLDKYISAFQDSSPDMAVQIAEEALHKVLTRGSEDPVIQQDFLILEDARVVLRGLYSIGFVGIRDAIAGTYVFCHDGRSPDRELSSDDRILIHPCYWMALNCPRDNLNPEEAEEIYDEYDIEISSETPEIRDAKIKALTAQLGTIEEGNEGAADFELWCQKAIRICFAKGLRNVELKPNKQAKLRRDIVATNLGEGDAWRRIYDDYGTRQVIFEVKNYSGIEAADYQQVESYLSGEYGRLAFIITRDESEDLYANKDVEWVREVYLSQKKLIIKLTGKLLSSLLDKLRNPQKHDAINNALHRLLDTYTRLYIAGQTKPDTTTKKGKRKKKGKGH